MDGIRSLLYEIGRYVKHPVCLFGHEDLSPYEIGTDGEIIDYYCGRCQKKIKSVSVEGNVDFLRLKKISEEEGWDMPDSVEEN